MQVRNIFLWWISNQKIWGFMFLSRYALNSLVRINWKAIFILHKFYYYYSWHDHSPNNLSHLGYLVVDSIYILFDHILRIWSLSPPFINKKLNFFDKLFCSLVYTSSPQGLLCERTCICCIVFVASSWCFSKFPKSIEIFKTEY